MKNTKKQLKFGGGLLIYAAVLLVLVLVGLVVFWQFLASYDASLPETAMKNYLAEMKKDDWKALLEENNVYETNAFESFDALYEKSACAIAEAELSYLKNYEKYSDMSPAYDLVRDGKKFATVTLQTGRDVGFGFHAYDVAACAMIEEAIAAEPFSVMVLAPAAAEVRLNGIALDESYITERDMESRQINKYSLAKETRPKCAVYTVDGFYAIPKAEAALRGDALLCEENGALFVFDYPEETFETLTVKAPSNAVVRINGMKLTDAPASAIVLGDNPYEASLTEHITMNTYVLFGLFEETDVTCYIDGKPLTAVAEGDMLMFAYPEELIYQTKIMAPVGATVTVNGIEITAETEKSTGVYDGFDKRKIATWLGGEYPMCDVYDIGSLYLAPEVKATYNGVTLNVTNGTTPSDYTVVVGYPTEIDVPTEIAAPAEKFVRTFMYYMTRGYYEFDKNIILAQETTLKGSDAFQSVRESGYGVYFNSCYDILSNEAKAVSVTHYTENCVRVAVEYAIDKVRYRQNYHDEGRYEVTLVNIDGAWCVVEFESIVTP